MRPVAILGRMNIVDLHPLRTRVRTQLGNELRQRPARVAVALAYFALAVATAVIGVALPKGVAAGDRMEIAMRLPDEEALRASEGEAKTPPPIEEVGKPQGKASCAECGIIESVQRIDTRIEFTSWCDAAEIARTQNSGGAFGRDFRGDRESLHETVAAAIASNLHSTKDVVTTRHRIVVRLRNGKRQVFDEATPRTVHVGDRIVLIAGAPRTNG
jgi:hypothetical protein